jgi:predicted signal transduction protein with EAL and GGDEF domain
VAATPSAPETDLPLAYLNILPVDELKVDRSFVGEMTNSSDDAMLVQSAIDLGYNLGMTVVAEGVEDHQTLVQLQDLGADIIQGYYLGRPMAETAGSRLVLHLPTLCSEVVYREWWASSLPRSQVGGTIGLGWLAGT